MNQRKRCRPVFDAMEGRLLMTAGLVEPPPAHAALTVHASTASTRIRLGGTIEGGYTSDAGLPDAGNRYRFLTVAKVDGVGRPIVSATLRSLGFVASGKVSGDLTFVTARGSITLKLTGPTQTGGQGLPTTVNYEITKGTGIYRNVTDTGTITLTLTPKASTSLGSAGRFQMTFRSGATPV